MISGACGVGGRAIGLRVAVFGIASDDAPFLLIANPARISGLVSAQIAIAPHNMLIIPQMTNTRVFSREAFIAGIIPLYRRQT